MRARLAPILALTPCLVAWEGFTRSVEEVEEGIAALEAGDADTALERFQAAAKEVPGGPVLQYDLGLAHLAKGEHDEALAALTLAVATPDRSLRSEALSALGSVHAAKEAWQEAADSWKRALMLNPTDEAARHNYEMAWLHLHPPCAAKEDPFEDNDAPGEGKPFDPKLVEEAGGTMTACPGDPDWYVVGAPEGHALRITVRTETEGAVLATTLLAPNGATLREAVSEGGVARMDIGWVEMEGAYQVGVVLQGDAEEAAYSLEPMALPPCPQGDDDLEDNDGPADARPLEKGTQALRSCPDDEDWFAVSPGEGEDLAVNLQYDAPRGALDLTLFDGDGRREVAASAKGQGKEGVFLEKPEGSFLVRVRAAAGRTDNVYQIEVSDKPPDSGDESQDPKNEPDDPEDEDEPEDPKDDPEDPDNSEGDDEEPTPPEEPPKDPEAQDALDVLRSLQEDDRNLAMERALRSAPPRRTERDW